MVSKARLRLQVLELIEEHRVLSTMEVCRVINGLPKDDYQVCHKGLTFGHNRGWKGLCRAKENGCKHHYIEIYRGFANGALDNLWRKGFIQTEKLRFWDKGRALPTDNFRFWFIDRADFEERILRQTLIPYVEMK